MEKALACFAKNVKIYEKIFFFAQGQKKKKNFKRIYVQSQILFFKSFKKQKDSHISQ